VEVEAAVDPRDLRRIRRPREKVLQRGLAALIKAERDGHSHEQRLDFGLRFRRHDADESRTTPTTASPRGREWSHHSRMTQEEEKLGGRQLTEEQSPRGNESQWEW